MMLAHSRYIPKVWAALVRVLTVARSLVAYERGAVGPSKDCAYEGPYIKAITGYPIALEGAEAACAHLSSLGNIMKATADLWSNESVQNVKLLGGMAPTVSLEQLVFATRLMNVASARARSAALMLRDWFVESDAQFDPQAYVLRPDMVIRLAGEIIQETTPYLPHAARRPGDARGAAPGPRRGRVQPAQDRSELAGPAVQAGRRAARGRSGIHRGAGGAGRPGEGAAGAV